MADDVKGKVKKIVADHLGIRDRTATVRTHLTCKTKRGPGADAPLEVPCLAL